MRMKILRFAQLASVCLIALCMASCLFGLFGGGVRAKITDISGQSYEVSGLALSGGSGMVVICGGARVDVPFKSVSFMRINPARISSVDGRPHYGVEVRLNDGTVWGGSVDGTETCVVCADNGFSGKVSKKAAYKATFSDLSTIEVLAKEKAEKSEEDEGEDGEGDE